MSLKGKGLCQESYLLEITLDEGQVRALPLSFPYQFPQPYPYVNRISMLARVCITYSDVWRLYCLSFCGLPNMVVSTHRIRSRIRWRFRSSCGVTAVWCVSVW